MLFQQLTTPSSYPKESGGPFRACPLVKPVCPSRWPYWTCSKRIHPLNQWLLLSLSIHLSHKLTNARSTQRSQRMSYHQSSQMAYLLSSGLPGQKSGHGSIMPPLLQETCIKLSRVLLKPLSPSLRKEANSLFPSGMAVGIHSTTAFFKEKFPSPKVQPKELWWGWSLFIVSIFTSLSDI